MLGTPHPCFISLILPPHEEGLSPFHKPETEALCVSVSHSCWGAVPGPPGSCSFPASNCFLAGGARKRPDHFVLHFSGFILQEDSRNCRMFFSPCVLSSFSHVQLFVTLWQKHLGATWMCPRGVLLRCEQWNTRQLLEITEIDGCMLIWGDLRDILRKSKVCNSLHS